MSFSGLRYDTQLSKNYDTEFCNLHPTTTHCPGAAATVIPGSSNVNDFVSFTGTDARINIEATVPIGLPQIHLALNETSAVRASVTCFNGLIYMAWQANDPSLAIHVGYLSCSWTGCSLYAANHVTLPGQSTDSAPSIAAYNGKLYVAWKGNGNFGITMMESQDGIHWYNRVVINDTAVATPTLVVYQSSLYLVWPGTDNPHHIWLGAYSDGNTNLSNHTCICSQYTNWPIRVGVYGNTLQLAWKGWNPDANVYTGAWSPVMGFQANGAQGMTTPYAPSINGAADYLLWVDTNNQVNVTNLY